ncbi:MAG TPA: hypothetical protein VFK50_03260 [Sphingomicrobium sp.]|nr:hypothetical protein [Sphingomicrobium sp.]
MPRTKLVLLLVTLIAAPSLAAAQGEPAPAGTADTRYCMRVLLTGNVVEPVRCWTRDQWADQGVDVDKEWAREGIRVIG